MLLDWRGPAARKSRHSSRFRLSGGTYSSSSICTRLPYTASISSAPLPSGPPLDGVSLRFRIEKTNIYSLAFTKLIIDSCLPKSQFAVYEPVFHLFRVMSIDFGVRVFMSCQNAHLQLVWSTFLKYFFFSLFPVPIWRIWHYRRSSSSLGSSLLQGQMAAPPSCRRMPDDCGSGNYTNKAIKTDHGLDFIAFIAERHLRMEPRSSCPPQV